jgi:hypothetical protein
MAGRRRGTWRERRAAVVTAVAGRSLAWVLGLCAALALGGCSAAPSEPTDGGPGTTSLVIPSLIGLDVADAVAELRYLGVLAALVDREHRPLFAGGGEDRRCRVVGQDPPPSTEVLLDELTVTVTITVRCPG